MSGEKCAQASLRRELEERLANHMRAIAALNADLAALAGIERQREQLLQELGQEVQTYMKEEWDDLARLARESEEIRSQLASAAERAGSVERSTLTAEVVEEIGILRGKVESSKKRLEDLTEKIEETCRTIRDGSSVARNQYFREGMMVRQAIRELAGLEAELESRLTGRSGGLRWVHGEAQALGNAIRLALKAFRSEERTEAGEAKAALSRFRSEFGDLVNKSERLALQDARRRRIAAVLDQALQESGFERVLRRDPPSATEPMRFLHERRNVASIQTDVPLQGQLQLRMQGRHDEDAMELAPDPVCPETLQQVIDRAEQLGVLVSGVLVKGPGGGWDALPIRGASLESVSRPKSKQKQAREKSIKPPD